MGAWGHGVQAAATHHTVARHTALLLYTRPQIEARCGAKTPDPKTPGQDAATATGWPTQHGTGNKATCCTTATPASSQSGANWRPEAVHRSAQHVTPQLQHVPGTGLALKPA